MVVRVSGIVLACAIGIGPAMAQGGYPYPPRVVMEPYADELPPGYYYRPAPGYYRRLPPRDYDDEVVIDRRGRRVDADEGSPVYPVYPYGRRYIRVVPGPYDDDPAPRPFFRLQQDSRDARDRDTEDESRGRERHAALPPSPEIEQRALPRIGSRPPDRQAALPPAEDAGKSGSGAELPRHLRRQIVAYPTREPAGSIVVDTRNTYLYYVLGDGQAVRYGIGVGREGFTWAGREKVSRMAEWPDWYPPQDMIERQPYLPRMMAGGPGNPLGARALYLGNTLYRIHGTNEPATIGKYVSSGCIRLLNEDIEDLYRRVKVGTRVVVLRGGKRPRASGSARR